MKKTFFILTIISLILLTSCNDKTKLETTVETESIGPENSDDLTTSTITVETPTFESSEVQKHANDYVDFIREITIAAKLEDHEKLNELMKQQVDWSQKTIQLLRKASSEDVQKWKEWETEIKEHALEL